MFAAINAQFNAQKSQAKDDQFIMESVLDVEEVLPGSEEEIDDEIDVDSVPNDVYQKVDKALDDMISSGEYDDTEAEELVDDDDLDDMEDSPEIEAIITEAVALWESSECEEEDDEECDDDEEEDDDMDDSEDDEFDFDEDEFDDDD